MAIGRGSQAPGGLLVPRPAWGRPRSLATSAVPRGHAPLPLRNMVLVACGSAADARLESQARQATATTGLQMHGHAPQHGMRTCTQLGGGRHPAADPATHGHGASMPGSRPHSAQAPRAGCASPPGGAVAPMAHGRGHAGPPALVAGARGVPGSQGGQKKLFLAMNASLASGSRSPPARYMRDST